MAASHAARAVECVNGGAEFKEGPAVRSEAPLCTIITFAQAEMPVYQPKIFLMKPCSLSSKSSSPFSTCLAPKATTQVPGPELAEPSMFRRIPLRSRMRTASAFSLFEPWRSPKDWVTPGERPISIQPFSFFSSSCVTSTE